LRKLGIERGKDIENSEFKEKEEEK